jgi:Coiled-coil domain-containing protein 124 /Oxs1
MPKKQLSTNIKAVEARERKATLEKEKSKADEKRKGDGKIEKMIKLAGINYFAYVFSEEWIDDDKNLAKKLEKKQEEERKKAEALRKKAEAKALLEQEEAELKKACVAKIPLAKKSQYEIEKEVAQRNKNIENINNPPKAREPKVIPLEENTNHLMADVEVASNIDQAISVLKVSESEDDRHPEKRMKAAFTAYEDTEIPILKAQNPSLKLSQLKQMVFKNWQKSPENPLNRNN